MANQSTLTIRGPITGLGAGDLLTFTLAASSTSGAVATIPVTLTAQADPVMAVLSGPRGDVLDNAALSWDATTSVDPDDPANLQPFRWASRCGRVGCLGALLASHAS